MRSHIFCTCKEREGRKAGGDFLEFYGACVRTSSERKGREGVSEGGSKREGVGRERAGGNVSEGGRGMEGGGGSEGGTRERSEGAGEEGAGGRERRECECGKDGDEGRRME